MGDSKAGRSRLALLIDNLSRYLFVISSFERKLILARDVWKIIWKCFDRDRVGIARGILNKVLRCNRAGAMDRL